MISKFYAPLLKKRAELEKDERGFTLIELLVVILIIGILAAIAIPVFLGQQNSAKDAAAKSDLSNNKVAIIAYATDKGGKFTGATSTTLAPYGWSDSSGTAATTVIKTATDSAFCIEAKGNVSFHVTNASNGILDGAC